VVKRAARRHFVFDVGGSDGDDDSHDSYRLNDRLLLGRTA
jgi:hypothetical protein